jgi:hypothetical protein
LGVGVRGFSHKALQLVKNIFKTFFNGDAENTFGALPNTQRKGDQDQDKDGNENGNGNDQVLHVKNFLTLESFQRSHERLVCELKNSAYKSSDAATSARLRGLNPGKYSPEAKLAALGSLAPSQFEPQSATSAPADTGLDLPLPLPPTAAPRVKAHLLKLQGKKKVAFPLATEKQQSPPKPSTASSNTPHAPHTPKQSQQSEQQQQQQTLGLEEVLAFAREMRSSVCIEILLYGNVSADAAAALGAFTKETVQGANSGIGKSKGNEGGEVKGGGASSSCLSDAHHPEQKIVKLPAGARISLLVAPRGEQEENLAVEAYYQLGPDYLMPSIMLEMFEQVISEPFFDSLRTKQQLGYSVSSDIKNSWGILGFTFKVSARLSSSLLSLLSLSVGPRKLYAYTIFFLVLPPLCVPIFLSFPRWFLRQTHCATSEMPSSSLCARFASQS